MNVISVSQSVQDAKRNLVILVFFALVALAAGVFVVVGTPQAVLLLMLVLLAAIAALTVPMNKLAIVLAALIPFQFYFFIPGTNLAAPAAVAFIATAATRVLITRGLRRPVWMVPSAAFLGMALVAAFSASSRYEALKGIYEWMLIFACIYIAAQTVDSALTFGKLSLILVGLGMLQAILGWMEYIAGLDRLLPLLASPLSEFAFPPNLLRERLSDLSFNWNLSGRALPFGTFINGIDYAIFLAAVLMFTLARGFSSPLRPRTIGWLACAFAMGAALFLTLKGSGLLAFAGGVVTLAVYFAPRLSREMWLVALAVGLIALLFVLPIAGSISARAVFLAERETSDSRDLGRLRIWASLLPALAERPLFGYGLNNSASLSEPLRTLKFGAFGTYPSSPESGYVQALIDTGVAGFSALASLFGMTFVRAVRTIRANRDSAEMVGILAALVALWTGNLTVSAFTTDQNGMLMGLLIGLVFSKWDAP